MLNIYLVKERVCALLKNRSLANLIKKKVQYSVENSFSKEICLMIFTVCKTNKRVPNLVIFVRTKRFFKQKLLLFID
jgi:hypothetical protein